MLNKVFIRSAGVISPQPTFESAPNLSRQAEPFANRLTCVEPDYADLIDAKSLRRMSRIIRMGVAAARLCLRNAQCDMPDGIVTGTAYGCLEDTGIFLTKMIQNQEDLLSPTAFIQSTHNTVGSQIALTLKCHAYNNTFVHRGFSFELALLDGCLLLQEDSRKKILIGGVDEITDMSHEILRRFAMFRPSPSIRSDESTSTISNAKDGEGAAFFLLSGEPSSQDWGTLLATRTFYRPKSIMETERQIEGFLSDLEVRVGELDLLLLGQSGNPRTDEIYPHLKQSIFRDLPSISFKQWSGDYPTASAFGFWLGSYILKFGPQSSWFKPGTEKSPKRPRQLLIYNHFQNIHHSLFLMSAC